VLFKAIVYWPVKGLDSTCQHSPFHTHIHTVMSEAAIQGANLPMRIQSKCSHTHTHTHRPTHTHTHTHSLVAQPLGAIWDSVFCPRTLSTYRLEEPGIETSIVWLVDDPLYHSRPFEISNWKERECILKPMILTFVLCMWRQIWWFQSNAITNWIHCNVNDGKDNNEMSL